MVFMQLFAYLILKLGQMDSLIVPLYRSTIFLSGILYPKSLCGLSLESGGLGLESNCPRLQVSERGSDGRTSLMFEPFQLFEGIPKFCFQLLDLVRVSLKDVGQGGNLHFLNVGLGKRGQSLDHALPFCSFTLRLNASRIISIVPLITQRLRIGIQNDVCWTEFPNRNNPRHRIETAAH